MSDLIFAYVASISRADCILETMTATLAARSMDTRLVQVHIKATLV